MAPRFEDLIWREWPDRMGGMITDTSYGYVGHPYKIYIVTYRDGPVGLYDVYLDMICENGKTARGVEYSTGLTALEAKCIYIDLVKRYFGGKFDG